MTTCINVSRLNHNESKNLSCIVALKLITQLSQ